MKSLLYKICFLAMMVALHPVFSIAQETGKTGIERKGVYKDGVARLNGQMILLENGLQKPLADKVEMKDGTIVDKNGNVTSPNGKTRKLKEGMAVNKQGRIVIFKDDMFTPEAISNNSEEAGYKQNTIIIEHPDTIIIKKQ